MLDFSFNISVSDKSSVIFVANRAQVSSISDDEDYNRDSSNMFKKIPQRIAALKKILNVISVDKIPEYIYYKHDDSNYVIKLIIIDAEK